MSNKITSTLPPSQPPPHTRTHSQGYWWRVVSSDSHRAIGGRESERGGVSNPGGSGTSPHTQHCASGLEGM